MVLSTVLVVISGVCWVAAAGMELFAMAFTDYCPTQTCSADRASASILVALFVAAALIVVGAVVATIRIIRRRLGWPFPAAALVLSIAAEIVGFVGYMAAVGYRA
ncbi:MAG TPA: hypothetical protein VIO95_00075 [Mycobacterium sp.]